MFSDFSTKGSQASIAEFASSFVFCNYDSGKLVLGNSPNVRNKESNVRPDY